MPVVESNRRPDDTFLCAFELQFCMLATWWKHINLTNWVLQVGGHLVITLVGACDSRDLAMFETCVGLINITDFFFEQDLRFSKLIRFGTCEHNRLD